MTASSEPTIAIRSATSEPRAQVGVAPGETTPDGEITLRAVECLGGCSTPTIVAVDHRYRQSVKPEDASAIVQELRGS